MPRCHSWLYLIVTHKKNINLLETPLILLPSMINMFIMKQNDILGYIHLPTQSA
ncbi:hypothetical protein NTGBS_20007 [Candidatus Nitrotoga sp. BS]|nr:hypothetical protein NTGBS_20007 [Candidatus Nitrotoga sp. BS]